MDSEFCEYDLAEDHPGYSLPVSNIAYHIDNEDNCRAGQAAVAQRAFQRILDSYDEYERLADSFQLELDKRQELINARKEREKAMREELQRQLKEEKRMKKMGRTKSTSSTSVSASPSIAASNPLISRQPYFHPYRFTPQRFNGVSFTDQGRGFPAYKHDINCNFTFTEGYDQNWNCRQRSHTVISSESQSHSSPDHLPNLVHGAIHSTERSPTNSPVLPLTPSPPLGPSDAATTAIDMNVTSSKPSLPTTVDLLSSSSIPLLPASEPTGTFSTAPCLGSQLEQRHHMCKKRKQAIPVHPSVVNRIPGITLRIQPDTEQHLQVEVLKNVEDYRLVDHRNGDDIVPSLDQKNEDTSIRGSSELQQQFQARQDLDKIRESIESSRPGYGFFSSSALYPFTRLPKDIDWEARAHEVHMRNPAIMQRYQKHHRRQSSASRNRSLDLYDPTGTRLNVVIGDQNKSHMTSTSSTLARGASPLSWDNFLNRDCQVNKVIGMHDKDFDVLEGIVQEAVARQQAASHQSSEEPEDSLHQNNRHHASSHSAEEQGAGTTKSSSASSSKSLTKNQATSPRKPTGSSLVSKVPKTTRATGIRATRGGAAELVEGYDDIERVMKEKRLKKREEMRRREENRMTSEPITDISHESDHELMDKRGVSEALSVDDDGDTRMTEHHPEEIKQEVTESDIATKARAMTNENSNRDHQTKHRKSASSTTVPGSPPSPPHSRQVTPFRNEPATDSRKSSVSMSSVQIQPIVYTTTQTRESHTSSTPPATPTRTTTLPPPVSSVRGRTRSGSVAGLLESGSALEEQQILEKGKNHFYDSKLDEIAAKERAKRKQKKEAAAAAVAAAVAAAAAAATTRDEATSAANCNGDQDNSQGQGERRAMDTDDTKENKTDLNDNIVVVKEGPSRTNPDLQTLKGEAGDVKSLCKDPVQLSMTNLPKSSKFLPGRVLRTARTKAVDPLYIADSSSVAGPLSTVEARSGTGADRGVARGNDFMETLDPDCTSCRLVVNELDRASWKQARQAGEIHLNLKRWGKGAILCNRCRPEYQKHHLRCTQCFYVPVITDGLIGRPGAPKAGGTCTRCKAGTWFHEIDH
ncbi:hypothetical protein BX616_003453 [Lobosporangium transversale]|uniref:Uncharacterized protein n=1 Tax=Lobosporangium transversale TaxID=64571 RepID=A0A1Y2GYR1_9FUNG|nr:hypothetical protein BCR41DRAFT_392976 [Lobosporangium transversale]KAF9898922.1 hypothetical protein BX616_003453 [Lobosporangium transversale]ORZ26944.1 hypothetical protein BCR41DRAFT_392976 [Lobosporangium transversale]|eukprot:XP_021884691.1 hypothetical protein BCR41DRAFT_392976 [Lobosporangium transversale]